MSNLYNVSSSPHVRNKLTTGSVMLDVALCLLPATVMGIWHFKLQAVMVIALAIISAVLTEYVFDYIARKYGKRLQRSCNRTSHGTLPSGRRTVLYSGTRICICYFGGEMLFRWTGT